jgi:membrane-bound lytic murein transglycosylase D
MEQQRALPVETRDYVAKIIAAAILTRHAEAFGLPVDQLQPGVWVDYELVLIPRSTSLSRLASVAGVSVEELRELNPELRRSVTPPRPYLFKIPRASLGTFAERWPGTRPHSLSAAGRERVAASAIGRPTR